jgi:hypothetical protein
MKFVVDCMLGKLAKWLKILGFDVVYFSKAEDSELLQLARREQRTLLSRDHRLLEEAKDVRNILIEGEDWPAQVGQVLRVFDLWPQIRPYSRCLPCNAELKPLAKKRAKNLVAPFVYDQATSFAVCPTCGRVFWQGTHFDDMESKIGKILEQNKNKKIRILKGKEKKCSS